MSTVNTLSHVSLNNSCNKDIWEDLVWCERVAGSVRNQKGMQRAGTGSGEQEARRMPGQRAWPLVID